jgi:DNA ligase-1
MVETLIVKDEVELIEAYEKFKSQGYEGAMVRNLNSPYEFKRSNHLQKMKEFEDAEFEIVGVEEGRGKLQGHAGAFVCKNKDNTEFKAKMSGEISKLKEYWENQNEYIGQMLTVKFQGFTGAKKVPRFPVGLRIRNYE